MLQDIKKTDKVEMPPNSPPDHWKLSPSNGKTLMHWGNVFSKCNHEFKGCNVSERASIAVLCTTSHLKNIQVEG